MLFGHAPPRFHESVIAGLECGVLNDLKSFKSKYHLMLRNLIFHAFHAASKFSLASRTATPGQELAFPLNPIAAMLGESASL